MNTGDRIFQLRKTLKMSQEQFGLSIGMSKSAISKFEKKTNDVSDTIILLVCKEYKVSEDWLRNGTGEMFAVDNNELAYLVGRYGNTLTDTQKQIMIAILKAPPHQREAINNFIDELIAMRKDS